MVVGDKHFTHFLPLQTATYLLEVKEDGSQHPVYGTCSWTVVGHSPSPYTRRSEENWQLKPWTLSEIEKSKTEEWDKRRQDIRCRNNE